MNHCNIEFMLREKRKLELEECERRRLLRAARGTGGCSMKNILLSITKSLYRRTMMSIKNDRILEKQKTSLPETGTCCAE